MNAQCPTRILISSHVDVYVIEHGHEEDSITELFQFNA